MVDTGVRHPRLVGAALVDASGFEHPRLIPIDIGLRTRFLPAEVVGGKTQDLQTLRTAAARIASAAPRTVT